MLVEPIHDLFAVAFKETTRLVLKRGRPSATGPTTVMQTHCRATDHEHWRQGNAVSWKATPYYESGARAWENSIGHFNLRVEDMLVRESILPQTDRSW
ncbi:hypothetical protein PF010_g29405 [Phytophthora fragariae]|uniref:Uncharacterized protein n=1 Tax=Phytophthora fragariae TaxID=53985 RepID=A0A6G0JP66_9STRA|nr:hypothetical protein PF003_g32368 [Phytophthora fragariae]KAE9062436.1 hypothetical protein PF010_g29405 [Phytophthora fragariae]